jgi:hypothetical protein
MKLIIERSLAFFFLHTGCCLVLAAGLAAGSAQAQQGPEFVKVGRYWTIVTANGSQAEASLSSGWFPADFNVVGNTTSAGSAASGGNLDLFAKNWTAPDGETIEKVVNTSTSTLNSEGTVVEPLESYVRYGYPELSVNNETIGVPPLGEVAPGEMVGSSAQVVRSTYEYALGVQAKRKVYAWSQQEHDDYVVVDVTFTNVSEQTINDFLIGLEIMPVDYVRANGDANSASWMHYYGEAARDSQRVFYNYHADDPQATGDNMGQPSFGQQEGRLLHPGAQFIGFLHTSEEPYTNPGNDEDDPAQPNVTFVAKGGLLGISENNREKLPLSGYDDYHDALYGSVADQHPDPTARPGSHHEISNDETGSPDYQAFSTYLTYSGFIGGMYSGIGPYTFEPGESIRLIYAVGQAGLGVPAAIDVGKKMVDETLQPPPNLPDAETGFFPDNFAFPTGATPMNINKDLWLSTVIDSVHEAVYRARWNYEHDWRVPNAPPPPASMSVDGFPDQARVTWTDGGAEELSNFAGYRVRRRISRRDTVFFDTIHRTSPDNEAGDYTFEDSSVQFGGSYQYYVQAGIRISEDNRDALASQRGEIVWSGRTLVPTPESIEPPRGGTEKLSDITVAPNPYNINDPDVVAQGWPDDRGILFFNLPAQVEINIYTEHGDHIERIVHDSPVDAGSLRWNMLTKNQQVIQSGVYIATFTSEDGMASRKFVVVR